MLCDRDKDLGTRMFGDPFLEYRAKVGLRLRPRSRYVGSLAFWLIGQIFVQVFKSDNVGLRLIIY